MLNSDSPFAEATRSIYFGNLPLACSIRDICDLVRGERGLESVRLLPGKSCAFVDFITRTGAQRFIDRTKKMRGRLQIAGQDVKLGWAKEKAMQPTVQKALENGATRNVYLNFPAVDPQDPLLLKFQEYLTDSEKNVVLAENANDYFSLDDVNVNEITDLDYPLISFLYGIFDEFGPLDMIKVVPGRRIAFIHMAQVSDAMRAVAELPTRAEFRGKRLAFGRDRCGERLDQEDSSGVVGAGAAGNNVNIAQTQSHSESLDSLTSLAGSRTVYLGGCNSPEITIEDICDLIHTGQLQSVRINRDRRCAFVTFISPAAAELFLGRALQFGLVIRNCIIKPAFAKENNGNLSASGSSGNIPSAAQSNSHGSINSSSAGGSSSLGLPVAISNALRKGYTRNVYLGNIDFTVLTETRLRTEMSRFGPLDRIQILKDRGVAFIHFANLLDGGRAFEQIKGDLCYRNCRVGFGKDRCEPHNHGGGVNPGNLNAHNKNIYGMQNMQSYYQNYPPPPLYFHPMMYDPNALYHHHPAPLPYGDYTINLIEDQEGETELPHEEVVKEEEEEQIKEEEQANVDK